MTQRKRLPFALLVPACIYLFSFLCAASSYGDPLPLLGRLLTGRAAQGAVLCDAVVSLYLFIGILKRQRLSLRLLVAYNLFDICSALLNLALIPTHEYARIAGTSVPEQDLRLNTMGAVLFLLLLTGYLIAKRRHFDNTSPYLF